MYALSRRQLLGAVGAALLASAVTNSARAQRAGGNVHPVIATFRRRLLRAGITPSEREQINSVNAGGTAHGNGHVLVLMACDNLVREILPLTLEASGRNEGANALRGTNPITDDAGAGAAVDRLQQLAASLDQAADCRGAACNGNAEFNLGHMARSVAVACQSAARGAGGDNNVAENAAAAFESGLHVAAARDRLVLRAVALMLAMAATAR